MFDTGSEKVQNKEKGAPEEACDKHIDSGVSFANTGLSAEFGYGNHDQFRSAMKAMSGNEIDPDLGFPQADFRDTEHSTQGRKAFLVAEPANTHDKAVTKETTNQDGSKIERDSSQRILKVTYPNGKPCTFERNSNGQLINISDADGSTWQKQEKANLWVNDKSGKQRNDMAVSYEGVLTYKDENSASHSVDRSFLHKTTNKDKSTIEERDGLIQRIRRPNGTTVDCKYDGQDLISMSINSKDTYSRADGKSSDWTFSSGAKKLPCAGAEVHADGTCIYQRADIAATETVALNGTGHIDYKNGARVEFLGDGKVSLVSRPNSSKTEFSYQSGNLSQISETYFNGEQAKWKKDQGKWRSIDDLGRAYDTYSVNHDGIVSLSANEYTFTKNTDGCQVCKKSEGNTRTFDPQKRLSSLTRPDGTSFQYEYADPKSTDKNLVGVIEKNGSLESGWKKDPATGAWTSPEHAEEIRRKMKAGYEGEPSYIALKDGQVSKVAYPHGGGREFERSNGEIDKVTETVPKGRVNGKETEAQEVWKRQEGTDNWSNGSIVEKRENVNVGSGGKYSYLNEDGLMQCFSIEDFEHREAPTPPSFDEQVKTAGLKLYDLVSPELSNSHEKDCFKQDLETFQLRAAQRQVTPQQIEKTFDAIFALVSHDGTDAPLDKSQRVELAKQILRHVAFPRAIDQGWHSTCNVATIEVVTATRHPEKFAALTEQVATTGEYKTEENLTVKPDANSLKPDFEAKKYRPYDPEQNNHFRSLASQIFQVTAVNSYYVSTKSSLRYSQQQPENPRDNGERLLNPQTKSVAGKNPNLTADQMLEVTKQIIGTPAPILAHSEAINYKTINVSSEVELRKKIVDLQGKKNLPAIIEVFAQHQPFNPKGGSSPQPHVVTIWNIDKTGKVLVDNQWGRDVDFEGLRRVPVSQLYRASKPY